MDDINNTCINTNLVPTGHIPHCYCFDGLGGLDTCLKKPVFGCILCEDRTIRLWNYLDNSNSSEERMPRGTAE